MTSKIPDERVIARLSDLPPAERAAFWQRACAEDLGLESRHPGLAALFSRTEPQPAAEDAPRGRTALSTEAMAALFEAAVGAGEREMSGAQIGHYKLVQKIGEGGFGVVWLAEQLQPMRRQVALKIIKVGMDTEEVIARFEAERQALALMDHPNIARVFDAGATPAGRPYFAMELVRGIALTRYCDDNRLPPDARLRLFVSVCQAVQHAHQKGVIHRDLKPSNILVTLHDGVPVAKVIDFGIAKATGRQLTEKTLVTDFHAFVGTPAYTSPEQMEMSGLDIDTRSDIYSLGVVLYELLAGRPPFDPATLLKSGLEEMRRTIREVDPPRPSHRLGTLAEVERHAIAVHRDTDAMQLSQLLRGDVDWVVMRCLEKDRTRRYDTASALARDVQRCLANEPVAARPPSTLYRARKLFRRHKLAASAATAVAATLVAGLIVASTLLVRERAARARAVDAEKVAERLRQEAEDGRRAEALSASRTSLALAEQMLRDGRTSEGLAHLVRAARADRANAGVGPRLLSALAFRSFAEPVGAALRDAAFGSAATVSYTKDGRHALIFGDGVTQYWDLEAGKPLRTFPAGSSIRGDVSGDGRYWASGAIDGRVQVWELATGREVLASRPHTQRVNAVRFSPDGRRLASASDDRTAAVLNLNTGKTEAILQTAFPAQTIAFAPDGQRVLTTTLRGPWQIWRLSDATVVASASSHAYEGAGTSTGGGFSPDGALVVITDQRGARLFDSTTATGVGARLLHSGPAYVARFTQDGKKCVTAAEDGAVHIWDVPTGQLSGTSLAHGGRVQRAQLAGDERFLLTCSDDGLAQMWDLTTGAPAMEPIRTGDVRDVDFRPDGAEFITSGRDGVVRRWRFAPGAARPFLMLGDREPQMTFRGSEQRDTVWAISQDRMQAIDALNGAPRGAPRVFPTPIEIPYRFSPNGRYFAVRADGRDELWDLREPTIARRVLAKTPVIGTGVGFSSDSTHMATVEDTNKVRVWSTSDGRMVIGPIDDGGKGLAFSPDSRRLAVAMSENATALWDLATYRRIGAPLPQGGIMATVQFSPDGRLLATASLDGNVFLWDAATGERRGEPLRHRHLMRGAIFSRDGRKLLTWTPLEVRVWDVATQSPLIEPVAGGNDLWTAIFSHDGTRFATWSRTDGTARLWGSTSGQLLAEPMRMEGTALGWRFTPDGRFLTALGNRLAVWPVPPQSGNRPVPEWLLRLATFVARGEIDARGTFRERAADATAFDELRRELAGQPDDALYVAWGRWILADRATRPIAPGFDAASGRALGGAGNDAAPKDSP